MVFLQSNRLQRNQRAEPELDRYNDRHCLMTGVVNDSDNPLNLAADTQLLTNAIGLI